MSWLADVAAAGMSSLAKQSPSSPTRRAAQILQLSGTVTLVIHTRFANPQVYLRAAEAVKPTGFCHAMRAGPGIRPNLASLTAMLFAGKLNAVK